MFSKVVVAGIGALGSSIVFELGRIECGEVYIADADTLEAKDLARSDLWCRSKPGECKASAALGQLCHLFPKTRWRACDSEIADVQKIHLLEADVVFGCVDTDLARLEMAAMAARYGFSVCDGGLGGKSTRVGRASWFPHKSDLASACFSCLLSGHRRASLLSQWESTVHPCWAYSEDTTGWFTAGETAAEVARLQVQLALFGSRESWSARSLQLDLDSHLASRSIDHLLSQECPLHEGGVLEGELFPVCARAECRACGEPIQGGRRIGWMRRWGRCPVCDGQDLLLHTDRRQWPIGVQL